MKHKFKGGMCGGLSMNYWHQFIIQVVHELRRQGFSITTGLVTSLKRNIIILVKCEGSNSLMISIVEHFFSEGLTF